jgi:hypothetical protein
MDIWTKTRNERERNAGLTDDAPTPPAAAPAPPAGGISFSKLGKPGPEDPALAAARQAKLVEMLRNR